MGAQGISERIALPWRARGIGGREQRRVVAQAASQFPRLILLAVGMDRLQGYDRGPLRLEGARSRASLAPRAKAVLL